MATTTIEPGQTVTFDTGEGGDTLRLVNNGEEDTTYIIRFPGQDPETYELEPGEIKDYNLPAQRITVSVENTGNLPIEATLS